MRGLEGNPPCSARFWLRRAINTNPVDSPNPKLEESNVSRFSIIVTCTIGATLRQCIHEWETLPVDKLEP